MSRKTYDENYRQLGRAITYEAIKEFAEEKNNPKRQHKIIKELRSKHMDLVSEGLSVILADKLETNPNEICDRVKKLEEEEQ